MENHITKNHITHKHTHIHTHTYQMSYLKLQFVCFLLNWLHWIDCIEIHLKRKEYHPLIPLIWKFLISYDYNIIITCFFIWNINSANVIKTSKIPFSFSSVIEWTLCLTAKPNSSYDDQRYFFIFLVKISNTSNIFITLCILTLALT